MAIVRWQPAEEIDRLRQEVDRIFSSFSSGPEPFFSRVYPALNLSEDPDHLYVRAELPGVSPESLEISVVEGRLLIRGERKIQMEDADTNYHRRERESGFFRRTLALPTRVDPNRVSAGLKDGVLTITLAKVEEAKPKKITVKSA